MPVEIKNILVFGDSLSDRGTMAKKAIGAFSGLWGNSPHGRFTNGFVWLDYFIKRLAQDKPVELIPPKAEQKKSIFSINNDEYVGVESAPVLARTYCVGGMTSADYSHDVDCGEFMINATRKVLDNLDSLRHEALLDDEYMKLEASEKASTLVIEWSGANDLITANKKPSRAAARAAVDARIQHLQDMIKAGYRQFTLFNMPDLSLTPRYQHATLEETEEVHEVIQYFNEQLSLELNKLKSVQESTGCQFHLFDANSLFTTAFRNPEQYDLDASKKSAPFLDSRAFKKKELHASAKGYMFWDDVHPTEAVHAILAEALFSDVFAPNYSFSHTQQPLVRQFQKAYGMKLEDETHSWCGFARTASFEYLNNELQVKDIVKHAQSKESQRSDKVLRQLGWMNKEKQCITQNPIVREAFQHVADEEQSSLELSAIQVSV